MRSQRTQALQGSVLACPSPRQRSGSQGGGEPGGAALRWWWPHFARALPQPLNNSQWTRMWQTGQLANHKIIEYQVERHLKDHLSNLLILLAEPRNWTSFAFPVTVTYLGLVMLYVAMVWCLNTALSPVLLPLISAPYTQRCKDRELAKVPKAQTCKSGLDGKNRDLGS